MKNNLKALLLLAITTITPILVIADNPVAVESNVPSEEVQTQDLVPAASSTDTAQTINPGVQINSIIKSFSDVVSRREEIIIIITLNPEDILDQDPMDIPFARACLKDLYCENPKNKALVFACIKKLANIPLLEKETIGTRLNKLYNVAGIRPILWEALANGRKESISNGDILFHACDLSVIFERKVKEEDKVHLNQIKEDLSQCLKYCSEFVKPTVKELLAIIEAELIKLDAQPA